MSANVHFFLWLLTTIRTVRLNFGGRKSYDLTCSSSAHSAAELAGRDVNLSARSLSRGAFRHVLLGVPDCTAGGRIGSWREPYTR